MDSLRFANVELLPAYRQLRVNAKVTPLGGRAYDLLLVLIEYRDRVVTKEELLATVWPGQVVEENNLTVQIAALRKVIGHDAISTVSGRGYRFTAQLVADSPPLGWPASPEPAALAGQPALALSTGPSIAVLQFDNLSGDPSHDYFADGIVEEIMTAQARMKTFFVVARNSSFVHKRRAVDVKAMGGDIGVLYVLAGSVRRAGGRLRITAQLIDACDGHHVWAERFEGAVDDVFALQDQITDRIVLALEPNIRKAEFERTRVPGNIDPQAHDL